MCTKYSNSAICIFVYLIKKGDIMEEYITIILYFVKSNKKIDIQVPNWISANELVIGLNEAYGLGIDTSNYSECYLKAENPVAFLRGNKQLSEFGLRNGSVISVI